MYEKYCLLLVRCENRKTIGKNILEGGKRFIDPYSVQPKARMCSIAWFIVPAKKEMPGSMYDSFDLLQKKLIIRVFSWSKEEKESNDRERRFCIPTSILEKTSRKLPRNSA
jgi:hypothetical protein